MLVNWYTFIVIRISVWSILNERCDLLLLWLTDDEVLLLPQVLWLLEILRE